MLAESFASNYFPPKPSGTLFIMLVVHLLKGKIQTFVVFML